MKSASGGDAAVEAPLGEGVAPGEAERLLEAGGALGVEVELSG